jgi:hypothetical protein
MNATDNPWTLWGSVGTVSKLRLWITKLDQLGGVGSVISVESNAADTTRIPVEVFKAGSVRAGPNGGVIGLATAPFTAAPLASEGVVAVKELVGRVKTFGPIISRLKVGAGLSVVASHGNAADGYYGACQLVLSDTLSLLGDTEVALLNGAREDVVNGIHAIMLPKSKNTSIRFKMKLGPNSGGTKIKFVLHLLSTSGGNLPSLGVAYRQIAAPSLTVAGTIPASDSSGGAMSGHSAILLPANGHILSESAAMPTTGDAVSNDTFFVEISRQGVTDGFAHDVGILEAYYVFE